MNKAKRRAASLKGWRVRKRMKERRALVGIPLVIRYPWGSDKIVIVERTADMLPNPWMQKKE